MNFEQQLPDLIDKLRAELEAYGKLYRFLEDQRDALLSQDAELILEISADIQDHIAMMSNLRHEREQLLCRMTGVSGAEGIPSISLMISNLTHHSKPLLEELYREVNRLVADSKRQLQRNQMLFQRAWDLGQQLIRNLNPKHDFTPVYKRNGVSSKPASVPRTSYIKLA